MRELREKSPGSDGVVVAAGGPVALSDTSGIAIVGNGMGHLEEVASRQARSTGEHIDPADYTYRFDFVAAAVEVNTKHGYTQIRVEGNEQMIRTIRYPAAITGIEVGTQLRAELYKYTRDERGETHEPPKYLPRLCWNGEEITRHIEKQDNERSTLVEYVHE